MRSLEPSLVRRSTVSSFEGVRVETEDLEVATFTLEYHGHEQKVAIDMGDKVFTPEGKSFWVPLYKVDDEGEHTISSVLLFDASGEYSGYSDNEDMSLVKKGERLPQIGVGVPSKNKLTEETWERNKASILKWRYAKMGASAVLMSGVVASVITVVKKRN